MFTQYCKIHDGPVLEQMTLLQKRSYIDLSVFSRSLSISYFKSLQSVVVFLGSGAGGRGEEW